jgi:hypothetical protein
MEQNQQGIVDLLEIYHARQLRDEIIGQLRRLRTEKQHLPIHDGAKRREIRAYYEALLLTVAELLHQMGDDELPR